MSGLIHIYCGDGKGKTTAATGLAVRAAGAGKKVVFAQFLKSGNSSEIHSLRQLDGIKLCLCSTHRGFFKNMNEEEKTQTKNDYTQLFHDVVDKSQDNTDLLVLDEIISACNHQIIKENELIDFLEKKPEKLEVVLTGRNPSENLLSLADYVTEMKKIKHPYDKGIKARCGIEF